MAYILSNGNSELLITSRACQEVALEAQERENLLITHPEIAGAAVFGVRPDLPLVAGAAA